jgi:S1-C subfamily serine protease
MEQIDNQKTETIEPKVTSQYRFLTVVILVSILAGFGGGYFGASNPSLSKTGTTDSKPIPSVTISEDSAVVDVVKSASPAVVSVVVSKDLSKVPGFGTNPFQFDPFFGFNSNAPAPKSTEPNVQKVGAGSGFFVSKDGLILTNKHVIADASASYTVLTNDRKTYDAKIVAQDPINDLAILKIDIKDAPVLELADSDQLQIGQKVIAIGNSLGQYQNTVTTGVVSGIGRKIVAGSSEGSEQLEGVLQTDAAINPGNSGGPLLNIAGQVIGINTAIDSQGQLVGFAIPANDAKRALGTFNASGKITRPYLGVRYLMITPELAKSENLPKDYGALVVRGDVRTDLAVIPGGPADKAGIVENDIILEVDGKKLSDDQTLVGAIRKKNPGESVTLKVYSKGQEKNVTVVLGESK